MIIAVLVLFLAMMSVSIYLYNQITKLEEELQELAYTLKAQKKLIDFSKSAIEEFAYLENRLNRKETND